MKPLSLRLYNGAERLLEAADENGVALECGGERLRYGELRERAARAAGAWQARGLRPGERVAVKLPDGFDWVVAWLGAVWAGGVAVGVNPRIPAPEWQALLDEARFDLIVDETGADTPPPWRARVVALADARREWAAALPAQALPGPAQRPAFWVHSSGSSGRAKGVVHAQRALDCIADVSIARLGIGPQDRLFASSKLFFTYPLVNALLAGLRIGATVLLDPQWPSAATVAAAVTAMRPSVLFSVPSLYRALLDQGLARGLPALGVRLCVSAGEALPSRVREDWLAQTGLSLVDGYGASETLALVLTSVPGLEGLRPSPGVQVEALEPGVAQAGGPTRLRLRTGTLALGYHDRPAAQAESFRDGAFCPADLFERTAGGGWRFAGREDSLIKIHGRWVDLAELEGRLAAGLPALREAAAARVPDALGGDAVAFFYAADAQDAAAVRQALAERIAALPPHQRPRWLHELDALPRTATGKLLRRQLVQCLAPATP